jgi:predicted MFS family arabinose efflux permease
MNLMPITESPRAVARSTSTTSSTTVSTTTSPPLPWRGLLALSAAVFLSITGEMLPTGLLPEMSGTLGVGEPLVGLLVSVFAFTVVVTSAPLTALTQRMPRRTLLVGVLVVLAVTTAVCAIAPEYWMLVAARIVGGIAHGLFWALVGAYAARLVPESQIGRSVSIVLGGGTLALILGVPASTALGQAIGWRAVFGLVAALTLAGAVLVWWALRSSERRTASAARAVADTVVAGERAADAAPEASARPAGAPSAVTRARPSTGTAAVLLVCAVTAITMIGQYAALTYVAPIITDVVGAPSTWVAPLLFVSGIAGAAGLVVAGSPIARRANRAMLAAMAVVGVSLVVLSLSPGLWPAVIAFAVWGFGFGAIPPLLQTRLLQAADPAKRDAASALYTTAFNVGIGGGALVGGVLFDAFGVEVLPAAFAILLLIAGTVVAVSAVRAGQPRTASAAGPVRPSAT